FPERSVPRYRQHPCACGLSASSYSLGSLRHALSSSMLWSTGGERLIPSSSVGYMGWNTASSSAADGASGRLEPCKNRVISRGKKAARRRNPGLVRQPEQRI